MVSLKKGSYQILQDCVPLSRGLIGRYVHFTFMEYEKDPRGWITKNPPSVAEFEKVYDKCICGHMAEDHHRSWFWGGGELIEECEDPEVGFNETGGMILQDGKWVEHCFKFRSEYEQR